MWAIKTSLTLPLLSAFECLFRLILRYMAGGITAVLIIGLFQKFSLCYYTGKKQHFSVAYI